MSETSKIVFKITIIILLVIAFVLLFMKKDYFIIPVIMNITLCTIYFYKNDPIRNKKKINKI